MSTGVGKKLLVGAMSLSLLTGIAVSGVVPTFDSGFTVHAEGMDTDPGLFNIKDNVILGLTPQGTEEVKNNKVLTIPDGVVGIKDLAFKGLGLTEVKLPDSLTTVGNGAFLDNAIAKVNLGNVTKVGSNAFQNNKLTEVTMGKVTTLGKQAFQGNQIESVNLEGSPLTTVPENAFANNKITNLVLGAEVTEIQASAFADNNLTVLNLPGKVATLGDRVFSGNLVKEVAFPDSLVNVGAEPFKSNNRWVKVTTNNNLPTVKYEGGYGHVVNPITIVLNFKEANTDKEIKSPQVVGDNLTSLDQVFTVGTETTFEAPSIAGWVAVNERVSVTPDRDGYDVTIQYKRNAPPSIDLTNAPKRFNNGANIDSVALLNGVTARFEGEGTGNIVSLTVSPEKVDSTKAGLKSVWYTAKDSLGAVTTVEHKINVGVAFADIEYCGGLTGGDYTYNRDDNTLTLNSSAYDRYLKSKELCVPDYGPNGETGFNVVYPVSKKVTLNPLDFYYYIPRLKKINSWGSAIGFTSKPGVFALPESGWGNLTFFATDKPGSNHQVIVNTLPSDFKNVTKADITLELPEDAVLRRAYERINEELANGGTLTEELFKGNLDAEKALVESLNLKVTSWGKLQAIPDNFKGYYLREIPESFGVVKRIGDRAFGTDDLDIKVTHTDIKDWGEVTHIGNYAFYGYRGDLPNNWGKVEHIGKESFAYIPHLVFPSSWGNVKEIGNEAFSAYYNTKSKVETTLPENWGKIENIGAKVFHSRKINVSAGFADIKSISPEALREAYADSLPKIPILKNGKGFYLPKGLKSIPMDIPKGTSVYGSLQDVPVKDIPKNLNDRLVKSKVYLPIGTKLDGIFRTGGNRFYIDDLTPEKSAFLVFDRFDFTTDGWYPENYVLDTDPPISNYVTDGSTTCHKEVVDPRKAIFDRNLPSESEENQILGLQDGFDDNFPGVFCNFYSKYELGKLGLEYSIFGYNIRINPQWYKIKYVYEDGREALPPAEGIKKIGSAVRNPRIAGYAPDSSVVRLPSYEEAIKNKGVPYEATVVYRKAPAIGKRADLTFKTDVDDVVIGKKLVTRVGVTVTGFGTPVRNAEVVIYNPGPNLVFDSVALSKPHAVSTDGNETFITLDRPLSPGENFTFPVFWKYKERVTPNNVETTLKATMYSGASGVSDPKTTKVHGHHSMPNGLKYVNESRYTTQVVKYSGDERVVAESGDNFVTYSFGVTDLVRNIDSYTIRDTLPTYKTPNGGVRTAQFVPEENPGWILKGNTVEYVGTNKLLSRDARLEPKLKLRFPGAATRELFTNTFSATLNPVNKSATEPEIVITDSVDAFFFNAIPKGNLWIKKGFTPLYNREQGYHTRDTRQGRELPVMWSLLVNGDEYPNLKNVVLTDYDLDPRLKYTGIKVRNKGFSDNAYVDVLNSRGFVLGKYQLPEQGKTLEFDPTIADQATKLRLDLGDVTKWVDIEVISHVRDTSNRLITTGTADNRMLKNKASFEATGVRTTSSTVEAFIPILPKENVVRANKTSSWGANSGPSEAGSYDLGISIFEGYESEFRNFMAVDLLPPRFILEDVVLDEAFTALPGARMEKVPNYQGTGRTALVFRASGLSQSFLKNYSSGWKPMNIGKVKGRFSNTSTSGELAINYINDFYITFNDTDITYDNQTNEWGTIWSKAQAPVTVHYPTELSTWKYVKKASDTDWSTGIETTVNEKFEYKLEVVNATPTNRTNSVIYDVLPAKGQKSLLGDDTGSEFSNRWDTSRQPTIPVGWAIQYYNSDTPVPETNVDNYKTVMEGLTWVNRPAGNTRAVRITSGTGVQRNSTVSFILPMVATPSETNTLQFLPKQEYAGKQAWNTFVYNDNIATYPLEPNKVYNRLVAPKAELRASKVDSKGRPMAGVVFSLKDTEGKVVSTIVTNQRGKLVMTDVTAYPGYTLEEVAAPKGFTKAAPIVLDESNFRQERGNVVITVDDIVNKFAPAEIQPITGNLEFKKVGPKGNPIDGVAFTLTNTSGQQYVAVSQRGTGLVRFTNVPYGNYTLTEARTGVFEPISPQHVKVPANKTGYVAVTKEGVLSQPTSISNALVYNSKIELQVVKIGINEEENTKGIGEWKTSEGTKLSTSLVFTPATGKPVKVTTSDTRTTNAILDVDTVYTITEPSKPKDYKGTAISDGGKFKVTSDGVLVTPEGTPFKVQGRLVIPNIHKDGVNNLVINKVDQNDAPVEDATFQLMKKVGEGDQATWVAEGAPKTTDEDGTVEWENLTPGLKRVREISAPAGYVKSEAEKEFLVERFKSQTFTYDFINIKTQVKLYKHELVGSNLERVQAAALAIKYPGAEVVPGVSGLFNVAIPLKDAEFQLLDEERVLETLTTGEDGYATVTTTLDTDKVYKLKETTAPKGYIIAKEEKSFKIADFAGGRNFDGTVVIDFHNAKIQGRVTVAKVDEETGTALKGAKFELKGKDNSVVKSQITDENGLISFDNLDYGEYTLKETQAPDGYKLDETEHSVTLNQDSPAVTVTVTNKSEGTRFALKKTNLSGDTVLEGAEFALKRVLNGNETGNPITLEQVGTGANTRYVSGKIPSGIYNIEETKAPEGYELLAEKIQIQISGDGSVNILNNTSMAKLLNSTGGDGTPEDPTTSDNPENVLPKLQVMNVEKVVLPNAGAVPYGWVIGVLVGLAVVGGAGYGVYSRRISRKSSNITELNG